MKNKNKNRENGNQKKEIKLEARKKHFRRIMIVIVIILGIGTAEFILFVYGQFSNLAVVETPSLNAEKLPEQSNLTEGAEIEYYTLDLELELINIGRISAEDIDVSAWLQVTNKTGSTEIIRSSSAPHYSQLGVLEEKTFILYFSGVPVEYDNTIEFYLELKEEGDVTERVNITLKEANVFSFKSELNPVSEDLMKRNSSIFILAVSLEGIIVLVTMVLGMVILEDKPLALSVSALGLAPLFRILNVATPIAVDFLVFITMSYGFLLVAVFIFIYVNKISWSDVGGSFKNFQILLPLAILIGFALAPIEYIILGTPPWIPTPTPYNLMVLTFVMIMFVGLAEELMFRALIQTHLEKLLSPRLGLLLTAILFGLMHGVWTSYLELVFTFSAGLLFGYLFQRTRNLPFIAVLHGVEDVFLFGLLPFVM